jgi:hypothetical protein
MASEKGGTSRVTTAPAAMTAPRPMLTPAVTVTLCPSHAPSPIMTGAAFAMPCRLAGRPGSVKA